jgi:hypothetical protein
LVVVLGWVAGGGFWGVEHEEGFGVADFDPVLPTITAIYGLPFMALAGWLVGASGWRRGLGYASGAIGCLGMSYLASFSWFEGFCIDPEDVC